MKECSKCKETKPLDDFHKRKSSKDNRTGVCKACYNKQVRERPNRQEFLVSQRQRSKEYYQKNREAVIKRTVEYGKTNAEQKRRWTLKTRYGISLDDYDELLTKQDNKCAICKGVNANGWALSVDHDHSCCLGGESCGKCVRGLLCFNCNSGLGNFRDSEETMIAAAEYIRQWQRGEQ